LFNREDVGLGDDVKGGIGQVGVRKKRLRERLIGVRMGG
jgi:hypothetical protein